ncbi:MAG: MmgE/PrpD family protein, partial [Mesorhizobium sp.]|nr:MmgE/PrpD family protein [Mesorhizobium sp.]
MSVGILPFLHGFRLADAPPEVVHQAKRCLLDLVGVAAAGSTLPASRIARSVAAAQFGGTGGTFLFDGRAASPSGAAFANSTTIDGFDAHDGHPLTKGHAGCGSLAGLLAFAGDGSGIAGAEALAQSPHLRSLKRLELDQNELTKKGVEALEKRFGRRLR